MVGQCVWPALCNRLREQNGLASLQRGGDTFPFKSSLNEEGLISQSLSPRQRVKSSGSFCRAVRSLTMCSPREV